MDVWVQSWDYGEARRLTQFEAGIMGSPEWTFDGQSLLFFVNLGLPGLFAPGRVDTRTGALDPVQLTDFEEAFAPRWPLAVSPDEQWLLFTRMTWGESELMLAENLH